MFITTNTCEGIGECVKQCPTKAIKLIAGKAFSCLTCGTCYKTCPNNAIFINSYGGYVVDRVKCNACGICLYNCPTNNISIIGDVVYGICSRCGVCVEECPTHSRVDGFDLNEKKQMDFIKSLNVSLPTYKLHKPTKKEVKRKYFGTDLDKCIFCGRCSQYCPKEAIKVKIDRDEGICTECRLCVDVCPNNSINKYLNINHQTCTLCLNCLKICPHNAIDVDNFKVSINNIGQTPYGSIVSCINCKLCSMECNNNSLIQIDGKLRYDPTVDVNNINENHNNMIESCPVSTLKLDNNIVIFDKENGKENSGINGFCVYCGKCVEVCDITHARQLMVDVWDGSISDDCIGCGICSEICPTDAITLHRGDISVDLDKCIFCQSCGIYCPTDAIPKTTMDKKVIDGGFNCIDQVSCIHCGLCFKTCSYDAIYKNDGNYYVDDEKCVYCGACKNACPANSFIFERKFKDSIEGK